MLEEVRDLPETCRRRKSYYDIPNGGKQHKQIAGKSQSSRSGSGIEEWWYRTESRLRIDCLINIDMKLYEIADTVARPIDKVQGGEHPKTVERASKKLIRKYKKSGKTPMWLRKQAD